jgi:hypothetical protein
MTLIAELSVNGTPFLIGDVLVTSDELVDFPYDLPFVGNINPKIASSGLDFRVAATAQKINLLSDRLAVAVAGPVPQAERALGVLLRLSTRENLTLSDIQYELEAIDQTRINELQLIGILIRDVKGDEVHASVFRLGVPPVQSRSLGTIYVAGSGKDAFLEILNRDSHWSSGANNEFQAAHAILGALVNEEARGGRTIAERWGGGFEALTFAKEAGRLQKVGDVLHTFWKFNISAPEKIDFVPSFYKTAYEEDVLAIRWALGARKDQTLEISREGLLVVPPLLKQSHDYQLDEFRKIDFSYRAIVCHVQIERASGRAYMMYIDGDDRLLRFDADRRQLHIEGQLSRTLIELALSADPPSFA